MTHPVTGAPSDVGTGHEARDRSAIRGPSRVREHAASRERIPTFVLDEHEDIAHVVASRIAALIREHDAAGRPIVLGLATGSTPIGV
jgi:glucosamine-6-phosphate deaminase